MPAALEGDWTVRWEQGVPLRVGEGVSIYFFCNFSIIQRVLIVWWTSGRFFSFFLFLPKTRLAKKGDSLVEI